MTVVQPEVSHTPTESRGRPKTVSSSRPVLSSRLCRGWPGRNSMLSRDWKRCCEMSLTTWSLRARRSLRLSPSANFLASSTSVWESNFTGVSPQRRQPSG